MDKLSVIGKIGTILSDLQKQQEFFEGHPDSLNEVEVELFAASASYLAEYAKVLKKFPVNRIGKSLAPPPPAVQAVAQDDDDDIGFRLRFEEDDKMIPDPVHSQDPEPAVEQQDSTEKVAGEVTGTESGRPVTEPETPVSENKTPGFEHETPVPEREIPVPENTTHGAESRTQVTESETQVTENETPRRVSLNDRFSEQKSTLYERIAPAKEQQQSSQNPVTNLGRSIGINERYYFIKALFQDDKVAFDQAITRIDMCHSLGEALEYANKSLAGKFNWNRKEEDARKFYDLLKKRFM